MAGLSRFVGRPAKSAIRYGCIGLPSVDAVEVQDCEGVRQTFYLREVATF